MARIRLDALLVSRELFPSRSSAAAAILAGEVRVADEVITKAGHQVDPDVSITVAQRRRFVSRGGEKLARALEVFAIDPSGLRCIDVGSSTGGFTDCLLQAGARSVLALDVGYGQLAWSLRSDDRVTVLERTNIRAVSPEDVGGPFDLLVTDVSFISLPLIMANLASMLDAEGEMVALIKPQFEVGKSHVGKRGVVREPALHESAILGVLASLEDNGLVVKGLSFSPITGPEGNIEFLLYAGKTGSPVPVDVAAVVEAARSELGA